MSALTAGRNAPSLAGQSGVDTFPIVNDEVMYAGGIVAIDSTGEASMASDTLGLRVLGICPLTQDNADDGLYTAAQKGVYRVGNSSTAPVTDALVGKPCYVEDDQTVAANSTNLVAAGLVFAVTADGVWVDFSSAAISAAQAQARIKVVAVTGTTATVSAAQAFQGNVVITASNASATTLTLLAAAAGYRFGVQRITAGAGYDVILQAGSGDKVLGSAAAGTASNTTDAVSDILWLESIDGTDFVAAAPLAADRAAWVASA